MRILVVEDDQKLAANLQEILHEEGYSVTISSNGMHAWETAYVENFDLILLDIGLPEMDGISILQNLRKENIDTPVILLTARGGLEDKVAGLDSGSDDYIAKPFAIPELLARVRAILRRKSSSKNPVISIGDLTVDTVSHEVRLKDADVSLTPTEYRILELLIFNLNRVVSRLTIAEHIWDDNFDLMTNIVDVHIANLRRKIGDEGEKRLITAVRGIGYIIKHSR